jgi:hypothetical protein
MMTDFRALCAELADAYLRTLEHINNSTWLGYEPSDDPLLQRARASLADEPPEPAPPADGEVAELVEWLQEEADDYECIGCEDSAAKCNRAAELLQRQAQQTLPQGLIPMEYVDADSSARIVSEPSEDGPGGCWVVRNSRHVNPCTEFPTAEAAWDALQRAQSLPSTVGPFDRIKFTCHLVPREQADG